MLTTVLIRKYYLHEKVSATVEAIDMYAKKFIDFSQQIGMSIIALNNMYSHL